MSWYMPWQQEKMVGHCFCLYHYLSFHWFQQRFLYQARPKKELLTSAGWRRWKLMCFELDGLLIPFLVEKSPSMIIMLMLEAVPRAHFVSWMAHCVFLKSKNLIIFLLLLLQADKTTHRSFSMILRKVLLATLLISIGVSFIFFSMEILPNLFEPHCYWPMQGGNQYSEPSKDRHICNEIQF